MQSFSHLKFEVDYSPLRNKIRDARVVSESDAFDDLKLFELTQLRSADYFSIKNF